MDRQKPIRMYTTPNFKGFLRELQAKAPDKSLLQIQDELALKLKGENKKTIYKNGFWGKI